MGVDYKNLIKTEYENVIPVYNRFTSSLHNSLTYILEKANINFFSIPYRVKDFESFFEKIERKKYDDPFVQTTDMCGLRIISFYESDVKTFIDLL